MFPANLIGVTRPARTPLKEGAPGGATMASYEKVRSLFTPMGSDRTPLDVSQRSMVCVRRRTVFSTQAWDI